MPAISDVLICNKGLIKIGVDRIGSFTDGSKAANILTEQYTILRDEVLEAHPWNFAIKRATLAEVAITHNEFAHVFQLPADCLRVVKTDLTEGETYKVEGKYLVTDAGNVDIEYISRMEDPSFYSFHFIESLASRIAFELCYSFTQSATLQKQKMDEYERGIRLARSFDAQGGGTPDRIQANTWLNSRA